MAASVQVLYPATEGTRFDLEYYRKTHTAMVHEVWDDLLEKMIVTKGVAGGPDTPPPFYAIATFVFGSAEVLQEAMGRAGPLLEDIPNFTDTAPQMLIGEAIG